MTLTTIGNRIFSINSGEHHEVRAKVARERLLVSPPIRRKYRASVAFATGCRRINKSRRGNRKIRVPIAMWPCRVEEKMTLKEVDGKTIPRKMAPNRRSGPRSSNDNENPDIAAIIAQQLQTILPEIVTQVTNNAFQSCNPKEYDRKGGAIALTRWIEKMENVIDNSGCAENQKVPSRTGILRLGKALSNPNQLPIRMSILRAGRLTDEAVAVGTLTKWCDKRTEWEESSKTG
ncbi:hypothetical protein Tco_1089997 [Tanacetum coccineum]|uniref:Reverse transcriptase domain-containing protein n=1 Tax=Tanacetum coccineum TaxID=301880 RepID=A0ABQ5I2Z1_9ASTR